MKYIKNDISIIKMQKLHDDNPYLKYYDITQKRSVTMDLKIQSNIDKSTLNDKKYIKIS